MFFFVISTIENQNDADFLVDLYKRYYPIMKKKAYEVAQDYSIVDDMIQESFIRLISKVHILRSLESYKLISYLIHTVRNVTLNYLKKQNRHLDKAYSANAGNSDDGVEWIVDSGPTIEEMYSMKEEYEQIGKTMSKLSVRDQQLLYYKYILELNDTELAVSLDIRAANVRSYLTRARRRALKLLLSKEAEVENEKNYG